MTKSVLIVDDSKVSRRIVRGIVETIIPGCEIIEAATGDEAVEIMRTATAQLALIDFNMPGMDGLEAARIIRELHPEMAITLLTANVQDAMRERAVAAGIGFIPKPPSEEKIRVFVEAAGAEAVV